jgi:REP element-mobilizing transposase RayT
MSTLDYQLFYRRHLPHFQPPGATLFVTFRLAGSIPAEVLERLREESRRVEAMLDKIPDYAERQRRAYEEQRRLFGKWDKALDAAQTGPFWLRDARVATMLAKSLHHFNHQRYDLDAFCIMPNHVHLVYKPLLKDDKNYHSMSSIMHSIKSYSSKEANHLLGRRGVFWQSENYDHVVRNENEWRRIINYVLDNPIAAGLVDRREDWKWSYCKYV